MAGHAGTLMAMSRRAARLEVVPAPGNYVEVTSCLNGSEAATLVACMRGAGLRAVLVAPTDHLGGWLPYAPSQVLVHEDDVESARDLLAEVYGSGPGGRSQSWDEDDGWGW